jgi:hypothetical protein
MELASCHPSIACNFEVAPRFLENLRILGVGTVLLLLVFRTVIVYYLANSAAEIVILMSYRTHLVTNHSCSAGSSLQSPANVSGRTRLYTLFTLLPVCIDLFLRVFDRLRFLRVASIPVCLSSGDSATFPCTTACDVSKPDRRMINCNPSTHK